MIQCFKKFSPCYKVISYISGLFPCGGEKAECTKASPFQKCKGRCFVRDHCPLPCILMSPDDQWVEISDCLVSQD